MTIHGGLDSAAGPTACNQTFSAANVRSDTTEEPPWQDPQLSRSG
jgi:hypothetical protein